MVLVIGALAAAPSRTRPKQTPRPPQFIEGLVAAYARNAVETYEREGPSALDSFLQHVEREANIRSRLFDAEGKELAGREATADERELAARVFKGGEPASKMLGGMPLEARAVPSRVGTYAFVATLPLGPPGPPVGRTPAGPPRSFRRLVPPGPFNFLLGESTAAFVARLLAVVLTAGALCYLLARYIVSPVVKLREVTRRVARGDLSARVSPLLGRRRDELAAMGRDFDEMATRVEALVSARDRLLRDISHELRSPLARLVVALDLARKRAGPAAAGDLARIEREATRLNELIGQLLTLSRRESDRERVRLETINLAALVREIASDADFEAQSRSRSVGVSECDECETTGTASLLRSAVENVVRNAVLHTPEGTAVKISLRCRGAGYGVDGVAARVADDGGVASRAADDGDAVHAVDDGDAVHAVIAVRDEGAGVPQEALSEIFRPFYRVTDSRARATGGTGLGLAITERAVRLHGGSVAAANVPSGGFVVELRLPVNREESRSEPPAASGRVTGL